MRLTRPHHYQCSNSNVTNSVADDDDAILKEIFCPIDELAQSSLCGKQLQLSVKNENESAGCYANIVNKLGERSLN